MGIKGEWYCAFLGEGSTDEGLIGLIESLLMQISGLPVVITSDDRRGSIVEKVSAVVEEGVDYDLIFVHRDADAAGLRARMVEFEDEGMPNNVVPIIPVRMTETWIIASLFDRDDAREWFSR